MNDIRLTGSAHLYMQTTCRDNNGHQTLTVQNQLRTVCLRTYVCVYVCLLIWNTSSLLIGWELLLFKLNILRIIETTCGLLYHSAIIRVTWVWKRRKSNTSNWTNFLKCESTSTPLKKQSMLNLLKLMLVITWIYNCSPDLVYMCLINNISVEI